LIDKTLEGTRRCCLLDNLMWFLALKFSQAIFAYEPQDADELRLELNDIVEVVKKGKYQRKK